MLLYPETKGKTVEQIDEFFGDQLVLHALENPDGAAAAMGVKFPNVGCVEREM